LTEAFQIVGGHGDLARARIFAGRYLEAQKACYGGDADDVEKWEEMFRSPLDYIEELLSDKWHNPIDQIPKDPGTEMEAWLWRRKAPGELY